MTAPARSPDPPPLPPLDQPIGSVDFPLRDTPDPAGDRPFLVAGRRARVTGGHGRGIDEVRVHPMRLARHLRVDGAATRSVFETPIGLERRLELGLTRIDERLVVPRDAPGCLIEWEIDGGPAELAVAWTADPGEGAGPTGAELDWRVVPRGVVAQVGTVWLAYAFDRQPVELSGRADPADARVVRFGATLAAREGESARLAIAAAPALADLPRALAAVARARVIMGARRGQADRLLREGLSLRAPDATAGAELDRSRVRVAAHVADLPGLGRTLMGAPGCGPNAGSGAPRVDATTSIRLALASLAGGDPAPARDTMLFLARHRAADGRIRDHLAGSSGAGPGSTEATTLYLRLVVGYLAWTGDVRLGRSEWPTVERAAAALGSVTAAVVEAAESVGGQEAVARLRELASVRETAGGDVGDREGTGCEAADVVLRVVRTLLGAEPDAPRGRLILRPRPPRDWDWFEIRSLAVGDAKVSLSYARIGRTHRLVLRQQRGATPLRVVLEPLLPGQALRSARVDGEAAGLDARVEGDRVACPLQVVMDHERTVELEVE